MHSRPFNFRLLCTAMVSLAWLGLCGLASSAFAEANPGQQYFARVWQTDDGLPRNSISAITQTPDGYLWLGTPLGVIRFDGVKFTPMEDEYFAGFVRARTRVLYTDHLGRLWIGTGITGIIRYDGKHFTVIDSRQGLPHPTITSICEDAKGTVWVATQDGKICWVDARDQVHTMKASDSKLGTESIQLVRDKEGRLWFAQAESYGQLVDGVATNMEQLPDSDVVLCPSHDGGMWVAGAGQLLKLPPPGSPEKIEEAQMPVKRYEDIQLLEDHLGNLWIGTRGQGLLRYANHQFIREFKSTHRIAALYEDTEHNLWVGTLGGGICRLRPKLFRTVNVRNGSQNSTIRSVCESADGHVWMSAAGPTLTEFTADGQFKTSSDFDGIGTTCVLPQTNGGVWVGTVNHGLYSMANGLTTREPHYWPFQNRQIRVLHQDAQGRLWLGCLPDGLARLSGNKFIPPSTFFNQGLPPEAIWAIADDHNGSLWLGTIRGELLRYDGGHFSVYGQSEGLPGGSIAALLAATNGDLWIGTLGGGLGRFRDGHFVFANTRNGLADDVISAIMDDGRGWFWLGTDRGICRVNKQELEDFADGKRTHFSSTRYGKDDGLESVECVGGYQPSAWRMRSGKIWFATSKGAVVVNPAAVQKNLVPPKLVLEKILVDDVEITNRAKMKLAYGYRKLEFEYTAPSFKSPERIRFRHQLVGLDADWVDAGTHRTVSYPRLAPGKYVFRFSACNSDGVWNQHPVTVAFEVTPAYWQTAWFRGLALMLFAGAVAAGVRYRYVQKMRRRLRHLEQAHAIEQERMRIARDIHDDLGARLTQMAFLSEMSAGEIGENNPTSKRLETIAHGSRQAIRSLEEIVWAVNPRKDSLPDFMDYLSHYANEFFRATTIRCRQDVPLIVPEIALPAEVRHNLFLACKEALNNIYKHAQATEVWLRMHLQASELEIVIQDNGRGFPSSSSAQSTGNGLPNLRIRIAGIGGRCVVESQPGQGTCVRFQIKLPDRSRAINPPSSPEPN